jgi:hypothetical protein
MSKYQFDWSAVKEEADPPEVECKGLYFRGYYNFYEFGGDIHLKQGLKFLKRKSCSGCVKCGWYWDTISEQMSCGGVILPDQINNGSLYTMSCVVTSTDWESGHADDWEYRYEEVEDV